MITFFGDSHIRRLQRSVEELPEVHHASYNFHPAHGRQWFEFSLNEIPNGFNVAAPEIANWPPMNLDLLPAGPLFFSSLFHTPAFLDKRTRELYCPWQCAELANERQVLSTASYEARFESQCQKRFELLELLRKNGFDVRALEAPKPPQRTPNVFKIDPEEILAVDGMLRQYIKRRLAQIEVPLVDAPASTHKDGFTLPSFSARGEGDTHHGSNEFYHLQFAAATDSITL